MKIRLFYNKEGLVLDVPEKSVGKIFETKKVQKVNESDIREKILDSPKFFGLKNLIRKNTKVCIVVSDVTRPIPYREFLPFVLEGLNKFGVKDSQINFLIATGCHRPNSSNEQKKMLGEKVVERYKIENHDAFDLSKHIYLGRTKKNTPVYINRKYLEAGVKITIGMIEPHFMAGFSGGRKIICPGICAYETTKWTHSPFFLENENSRIGNLEGNVFHRELSEIARKAEPNFSINVVVNYKREVVGIFAGDLASSFLKGVEFCKELCFDYSPYKYETVITSGGGYPLDTTFYQTIKAIVNASQIVKEDGIIIVLSSIREGIGSKQFVEIIKNYRDEREFLNFYSREENFALDQWQMEEFLKVARKNIKIYLYTDAPHSLELLEKKLKIKIIKRISELLNLIQSLKEPMAVIPEGPYVAPIFGEKRNLKRK
ncbi:nickel-dependent lactate racemase [Candidatus Calescamantes bacterium]|nr:nickel-dependent lactate racemase [Candidatus Calescamantes bacterium]